MTVSELTKGKTMLTLAHDAGLAEALVAFEAGVSHLPVVDEAGAIIGFLTEPDIRAAKEGETARQWISGPVPSIEQNAAVGLAAQKMIEQKTTALLLSGRNNEIVGMVTVRDLLGYLVSLVGTEEATESIPYSPVLSEAMRELNAAGL